MSAQDDAGAGRPGSRDVAVLYVEDNQQTGPLVRDWLERHDDRFDVTLALTLQGGAERLEDGSFDCVVSDYRFPDGTGLDLLRTLEERGSDVPFLLYSARADADVEEEARDAGVTDIVRKGDAAQLGELADRILAAVTAAPRAGSTAGATVETESEDQLERFASEIAHDLRGPLSLAYGHLDLIDGDDDHEQALRDALADLEETVDGLSKRAARFEDED